jgi:hypothetical protein
LYINILIFLLGNYRLFGVYDKPTIMINRNNYNLRVANLVPHNMSKGNQLGLAPFDASDYLDNEDTIAEYLAAALENPDPDAFLVAVGDVAKARGISKVASCLNHPPRNRR